MNVLIKEIDCKKNRDPHFDELYCIATDGEHVGITRAVRRIVAGKNYTEFQDDQRLVLTSNASEITVLVFEQKAFQDSGKFAAILEQAFRESVKAADTTIPGSFLTLAADILVRCCRKLLSDTELARFNVPTQTDQPFAVDVSNGGQYRIVFQSVA